MVERISLNEIETAKRIADRVAEFLHGPTGLHDAVTSARILSEALEKNIAELEKNCIGFPIDRLRALRNLSTNLDEKTTRAREAIAMVALMLIEEQGHFSSPHCAPLSEDRLIEKRMIEELKTEIVAELNFELEESQLPTTSGATLQEHSAVADELPIIGNRETLIYHVPGGASYASVSQANRVAFSSVEAAELEGYRRSKF